MGRERIIFGLDDINKYVSRISLKVDDEDFIIDINDGELRIALPKKQVIKELGD